MNPWRRYQAIFPHERLTQEQKKDQHKSDIQNINRVSSELMRQKSTGIPRENGEPFNILWISNCVLHSVVVAFLLEKGWKKRASQRQGSRKRSADKDKEKREQQVKEETVNCASGIGKNTV